LETPTASPDSPGDCEESGRMALPKPDFMSIKETSNDQKMPLEVIQWFIEAEHLKAYVPIPSDHFNCSKNGTTAQHYARAKDRVRWMRKGEGSPLELEYIEILNEDGKINKVVSATQPCLFNEVMISTLEMSELVSGFSRKKTSSPVQDITFTGSFLENSKPITDKNICPKCFTPISGNIDENGAISYPEPVYLTLKDTAIYRKLQFEQVLWFIEIGHLMPIYQSRGST
jgi:hypothetical protein